MRGEEQLLQQLRRLPAVTSHGVFEHSRHSGACDRFVDASRSRNLGNVPTPMQQDAPHQQQTEQHVREGPSVIHLRV